MKNSNKEPFFLVGKTEVVKEDLQPDFTTSFRIDYYFEKKHIIKFQVYDQDEIANGSTLIHIGDCETTVSKIMCDIK